MYSAPQQESIFLPQYYFAVYAGIFACNIWYTVWVGIRVYISEIMGCNSFWCGYSIHKYKEISDFYVRLEIETLDLS